MRTDYSTRSISGDAAVYCGRGSDDDSAGLGELVHAHITIARRGGALKIVTATRRLRDLLVLTKLMSVLEQFEGETAAVARFHEQQPSAGTPGSSMRAGRFGVPGVS